jgi:hypothetical protein
MAPCWPTSIGNEIIHVAGTGRHPVIETLIRRIGPGAVHAVNARRGVMPRMLRTACSG